MPRRRTSNADKELKGTARKDRTRREPEFPPAKNVQRPKWLVGKESEDEWDRLVGLLSNARVLTDGDLSSLGHLCNLHGTLVRLYIKGQEPTAAQLTQLRLFLGEFGLTPASRSKATPTGETESKNPFEALLRSA